MNTGKIGEGAISLVVGLIFMFLLPSMITCIIGLILCVVGGIYIIWGLVQSTPSQGPVQVMAPPPPSAYYSPTQGTVVQGPYGQQQYYAPVQPQPIYQQPTQMPPPAANLPVARSQVIGGTLQTVCPICSAPLGPHPPGQSIVCSRCLRNIRT